MINPVAHRAFHASVFNPTYTLINIAPFCKQNITLFTTSDKFELALTASCELLLVEQTAEKASIYYPSKTASIKTNLCTILSSKHLPEPPKQSLSCSACLTT